MAGKGRTPRWRHTEHERFARAVEGGPQPVGGDEDLADDLAIVELLRRMDVGPDADMRERIRQRVLTAPPPEKPLVLASVRRVGARGRLAVAAAAVLCLLMSLGGMSVLLSRDALPGDPLYGVKRTAEGASLGLTFGDESRALKHLEFAAARMSEMETLADRGAEPPGHLTALDDFDADAMEGTRQLTAYGTTSDKTVLPSLRDWALSQYKTLGLLRPRLPEEAGKHADTTMWLLAAIAQRADELARSRCTPVASAETDDLGPLPSRQECSGVETDPNASASRDPSVQPTRPGMPVPGPTSGAQPPSSAPGQPSTPGQSILPPLPGTSTPPTTGKPGITIPLPLPLPTISLPGLPGISFG